MAKSRKQLYYNLKVLNTEQLKDGSTKVQLHASDRYSRRRYTLERRSIVILNNVLDRYLKKRPHLQSTDRKNTARKFVYLAPGMRAWAQYMPGGFATFHVHNPKRKHLESGKRLDYLTRALFRHSFDGQGLRSRAYAMTWFIKRHMARKTKLSWLSIGCGTGQPTFDAAELIGVPTEFTLVDGSEQALEFATKLAHEYGIKAANMSTHRLNVIKDSLQLEHILNEKSPNVIDAMGLFEYLDDTDAASLLAHLYENVASKGVLVFTNMLSSHPHLDLHKRGLGWPGVIQRTIPQMRQILKKAGIPAEKLTVMLPDDGVYAVYGVIK